MAAIAALAPASAQAAHDLTISMAPTANVALVNGTFSPTADSAILNVNDLLTALDSGNVTVDTGSGASSQTGLIAIGTEVVDTNTGSGSLTFNPADTTILGADVGTLGFLIFENGVALDADVTVGSGQAAELFAASATPEVGTGGVDLGSHELTFFGAGFVHEAF